MNVKLEQRFRGCKQVRQVRGLGRSISEQETGIKTPQGGSKCGESEDSKSSLRLSTHRLEHNGPARVRVEAPGLVT